MTITVTNDHLDERDQTILAHRLELLNARSEPRVGDFVRFADGIVRRFSHIWDWDDDDDEPLLQSSDSGSYYLGDGYVTMSGTLHPCVPASSLTLTDETRHGDVWFFNHDFHTAHNSVAALVEFRVYTCDRPAPR